LIGSVSEASFFAVLLIIGASLLGLMLLAQYGVEIAFLPQFIGWSFWLMILVLVSFTMIGGGGLLYALLHMGTSAERRSDLANRAAAGMERLQEGPPPKKEYPNIPHDENLTNSPGISLAYRLPIAQTSLWRLAVAGTFCLACLVATLVLATVSLPSLVGEEPQWLLAIFSLLLAALGAWSISYFLRQWMSGAGVGATSFEISDHPLHPGGEYEFFLSQQGRLRLRSLSVSLICVEQAVYRQGTDVRTESGRVAEIEIFRSQDIHIQPAAPFEHQGTFTTPTDAMHSFQSRNNSVLWKIHVQGEIEQWPTFERSYPIIMHPAPCNEGAAASS
jgi:energy-coupling factor transporter transmembrane protein EcfT